MNTFGFKDSVVTPLSSSFGYASSAYDSGVSVQWSQLDISNYQKEIAEYKAEILDMNVQMKVLSDLNANILAENERLKSDLAKLKTQ